MINRFTSDVILAWSWGRRNISIKKKQVDGLTSGDVTMLVSPVPLLVVGWRWTLARWLPHWWNDTSVSETSGLARGAKLPRASMFSQSSLDMLRSVASMDNRWRGHLTWWPRRSDNKIMHVESCCWGLFRNLLGSIEKIGTTKMEMYFNDISGIFRILK